MTLLKNLINRYSLGSTLVIALLSFFNYWYIVETFKPKSHVFALMKVSRDNSSIRESSKNALSELGFGNTFSGLMGGSKSQEIRREGVYVKAGIESLVFFEEELYDYFLRELEVVEERGTTFDILRFTEGFVFNDLKEETAARRTSLQKAHKDFWEIVQVRLNGDGHVEIRAVGETETKANQIIEKLVESFNRYYMKSKVGQLTIAVDGFDEMIDKSESIEVVNALSNGKFLSIYQLRMANIFDSQVLEYIKRPEPDRGYRSVKVDFWHQLIQGLLLPFVFLLLIFRLFVVIFSDDTTHEQE